MTIEILNLTLESHRKTFSVNFITALLQRSPNVDYSDNNGHYPTTLSRINEPLAMTTTTMNPPLQFSFLPTQPPHFLPGFNFLATPFFLPAAAAPLRAGAACGSSSGSAFLLASTSPGEISLARLGAGLVAMPFLRGLARRV